MKRFFLFFFSLFLIGCMPRHAESPDPSPLPQAPQYTVILDFGHGGFDGGAVGIDTGVAEADLNLAVGLLVQDSLEAAGCRVLLTRPDENALAATKKEDMHLRGERLQQDADCTVSIHMNKFSDRSVAGPMTFFQPGSDEGQRLAQCVIDRVTDALQTKSRCANPANNFVTRVPSVPSVLVECGFLSNPADERNLQDPPYQKTLADAIAAGVLDFLASRPVPSPSVEPNSTEPIN